MSKNSGDLVIRHLSDTELKNQIRELEKVAKKVNRLHFIQQLYDDHSVSEACSILKVAERTGYNWLKKWNIGGLKGLDHKKGAGRPSFLTEDQFKEVDEYIRNGESLGTDDVHKFIEDEYGVDYTPQQVRKIINKLEYGWIKPYPIFSKSPENAKEILKEDAEEINPDEDIYGFFDESAFQNQPNISKILKKKEKNQNQSKS